MKLDAKAPGIPGAFFSAHRSETGRAEPLEKARAQGRAAASMATERKTSATP
jgi:hypothetical protein